MNRKPSPAPRIVHSLAAFAAMMAVTLTITACSGDNVNTDSPATSAESAGTNVRLNGSGASFPFPIYSRWFKDFSEKQRRIRVEYQVKGSDAGIRDFINGTVDFAASDAAMEEDEIGKIKRGAILLPMTAGEVVLAYHLPGIDTLRLPRSVYPEIFLGKIDRWNDPQLVAANPGIDLPDTKITVVTRSDSSGTTFVFTGHLSAVNANFKSAVGQAKAPNWPPAANFVKAPRNDGIAAQIRQIPGAIGYVEYGFAKLTGLPSAQLENKSGNFISPGPEAGAAALSSVKFPARTLPGGQVPNLIAWVWDPGDAQAYPIASFTWLLVYAEQDDHKANAMRKLVNYMLSDSAQDLADSLGYIPLPNTVRNKVREAAEFIQ
ncbi:phosphate ABC transporter substrate-binding protein PstS [Microbulbifer pacificus]|uniref:phosphate ABC transporter substrate-binding protein PstS n=1 Tax=Microbulbifer pacificus TaxID=407164 RepID=UPI0018F89CDA|nr:phosphate ABC transporter substrate-binding protein PstS [Microbulbifer pacificus]